MYKKKRERERERANRNNPRTLQMTTLVCVHFRSGKREREDERRENRRGDVPERWWTWTVRGRLGPGTPKWRIELNQKLKW
jgi:hypothetical protein